MKGIISWFAHNSVAANLLMVVVILAGVLSLGRIQQKAFPDINVEVIQIAVPYLGAAPEEVEEGVCVRIEEEIQGINGLERITSTATEGRCGVGAELISGYSVDRALSEIKNAVDGITTFPAETEKPVVSHYAIKRNAIQIALSGDVGERPLKEWGQRIRDEIAALPGITQVDLVAARNYELSIEVSEESLRRHRLSFDQVTEAVRSSSLDLPGGSIKTQAGEILLRTKGQAYTGRDFESIVVRTQTDGTRLLLGEIATVQDGFEEDHRYARFDGEPAVMIQVHRVGDQRVLELVASVRQYVEAMRTQLPEGVELTVWRDGSRSLRDRLRILFENLLYGFILVFVLLACFLRLRLAFWVCIGIPLSFLGALALFPSLGLSINVVSLFAFILVLGLLVDDAIVVGENVHTHQERAEDPLHAAVIGTQEVSVPVIFGVLTTVAAFLPMVMAPGALGQIFGGIGTVVVCCLFFSLVESQLVLPCHLGHAARDRDPGREEHRPQSGIRHRWKKLQSLMAGSLTQLAERGYRPALERALEWRYSTLALGVVALAWTLSVAAAGSLGFSFFPAVEDNYLKATLTMPQGTPVGATADAIEELEAAIQRTRAILDERFPDGSSMVKHTMSTVGEHPSSRGHGGNSNGRFMGGGSHQGEVEVELVGADFRSITATEITEIWRQQTQPIADAEELVYSSSLFSAGKAIDLRLQSAREEDLVAAADELKERLAEYPGLIDISDSFRVGKQEIVLSILPSAESLGLSLEDLASQVRQAFYGQEVQRIQRNREDVRVMVRYPQAQRRSLGDLADLRIRTPQGAEVPFDTVARAEMGRGYASIKRSDRQRVIDVTADVDLDETNSNEIMRDLRESFLPQLLAHHPGLSFRLGGEQREQQKLGAGLLWGFGFAMILVYALLAIPLGSYTQPLIIMAVIPFGLVGAVGGHMIMGQPTLNMMSVFGVVALSGVVVNSSLVLVHYVNICRKRGMPLEQAVRDAGVARFRPIVLTAITTVAGLMPLLAETSISAQFLIPMAISLAFGVAFATFISLFLVPSSYLILEDARRGLRSYWRELRGLLRPQQPTRQPAPSGALTAPFSSQPPEEPARRTG